MNKRWEIEEKIEFENECERYKFYKLYFTQFYDEEFIIGFVKGEDNWYIVSSPMLNIKDDNMLADNIEDAKEKCEERIEIYIQDQINYYEDMLEKFNGD